MPPNCFRLTLGVAWTGKRVHFLMDWHCPVSSFKLNLVWWRAELQTQREEPFQWKCKTKPSCVSEHPLRPVLGKCVRIPDGGHIFLSRITSAKSTFSKVRLVSESARRDLSKEPIKGWGLCKSAVDLNWSFRSGRYHKLHHICWYRRRISM